MLFRSLVATPSIKEPYLVDVDVTRRSELIDQLYQPEFGQDLADFSNVYYWDTGNPAKIAAINPDAKIILTVRKPSARVISHFGFIKRNGLVAENFTIGQYLDDGDADGLVARSTYLPIIDRYVAQFGRAQVIVLPLELLGQDPQSYADKLIAFLGGIPFVLDDADKSQVLAAVKARSRGLARLAKWLAGQLRRMGMLKLLGRLKRMALIRKILYRSAANLKDASFGSSAAEIAKLDAAYPTLLEEWGVSLPLKIGRAHV